MKLKHVFDFLTPDYNQKRKMLEVILRQSESAEKKERIRYIPKYAFGIIGLVLAVSVSGVLLSAVRRSNDIMPGEGGFTTATELDPDRAETAAVSLAEKDEPSIEWDFEDVYTEAVKSEEYPDRAETTVVSLTEKDEPSIERDFEEVYTEAVKSDEYPNREETAAVTLVERGEEVVLLQLSAPMAQGEYHVSEEYESFTGHKGIDLAAERGTAIYAAADGIVSGEIFSEDDSGSFWNGGYGNCVIIEHENGISTLYAHCSEVLVRRGQEVKKGDLIARVGQTGLAVGNCLHFEVMVDGELIDPRELVDFD